MLAFSAVVQTEPVASPRGLLGSGKEGAAYCAAFSVYGRLCAVAKPSAALPARCTVSCLCASVVLIAVLRTEGGSGRGDKVLKNGAFVADLKLFAPLALSVFPKHHTPIWV